MCVQVELAQTMQHFQQHLQQTALIAQQLLAQQVAGQAARDPLSSSSNSRPSSAAMRATHRLSRAHSGSNGGAVATGAGSRPGSRGQPGRDRLPAAAVGTQGSHGSPSAAGAAAVVDGLWPAAGLMQLEGVLEADEPPTVEEVQAYALYLGIDPVQVRLSAREVPNLSNAFCA